MWSRLWSWLERRRRVRLGTRGEAAAARFLRRQGYQIVARQRQTGHGELDLVALDHGVVVFVEVKTRRSDAAGRAVEAVDAAKQRRLTRAALAYLRRNQLLACPVRFDVVGVDWPHGGRKPVIEHIPHAFEPPGTGQFYG